MLASPKFSTICLVVVLFTVSASTVRAIDYVETIQGELSDNPAAPTSLGTLPIGAHTLSASVVEDDYDLLTFTLAPRTRLSSIVLDSYAGSTFSFSGIQAGPIWTAGLGYGVDPEPLLGWILFGETTTGRNLLANYAAGSGAIGFSSPLEAGDYTLELQETGSIPVAAHFTLTVVPEPSAFAIGLAGCLTILAAGLRRRSIR